MDCNSTKQKISNRDWTILTDRLNETWRRERQHGLLCKDTIPKVVQYREHWECPAMTTVKVKVTEERFKMLEELCSSLQKSASVQAVHHQDMTERMAKLEADNLHLKQEENKTKGFIIKLEEQCQQQMALFHIMDEKYIVSIRNLETENLHLKKEMETWMSKYLQDKEIDESHRMKERESTMELREKVLMFEQQLAQSCRSMEEKYMERLNNLEAENLHLKEEMDTLRACERQVREKWNKMENLETMIKAMEQDKAKHEKEMSLMLQSLNKLEAENLHLKKEMENWTSKYLQDKEINESNRLMERKNNIKYNIKLSEDILLCQQQLLSFRSMEENCMEKIGNLETEAVHLKEEMDNVRARELQMRERWNRVENLETMIKVMEHDKGKHEKEMSLMLQSLDKLEDFTSKLMEEKEREKNAKDGVNERESTEEGEKKGVKEDPRKGDMVRMKEQEEERRGETELGTDTERTEDQNTMGDNNDMKLNLGQNRRKKKATSKEMMAETAQKTLLKDDIALTPQEVQSTPAVSSAHKKKKKKKQKEATPMKMEKTEKEKQLMEEERKKALLIQKLEEARLRALEEVAAMARQDVQN